MPTFAAIASRLSPRGWIMAVGGTIAAIVVLYTLLHLISQPSYTTLLTGLEPAQTGKMTSTLDQKGISYELQNNGTALAVQSNETAQARVALAGAGLLESSQPGLSLFDKTNLGESSFQQQVNYQRALQGQLAQTIDQIQGISGAQVELVLPNAQSQLFAENQTQPSAAVLLPGSSSLEPSTVSGIAHLVASSVPGLKTSNVTITGGSGQLLWPAQGSGEGGEGISKEAAEARYDQQMDASLDTMLAQTLGPEKAQVQVYANLNVNQTKQEELTYGKAVPLTQSKNLETLTGSGAGAAGAATVPTVPTAQSTGGNSNYKHEIDSTTFGVDKTVKHFTVAAGEVESQHVSVLLDRSVPAAEVATIKQAVTNAAGIDPARGDTLSVAQMSFAKAPAGGGSSMSSMLGYAKDLLLGAAAIAFLFFTTRFLRKREDARIDHEPAWLRELEMPVPLAQLERETGAAAGTAPSPVRAGNGGNSSDARREVEQLVSASPDRVAQQLRTWMQEE